MTKRTTSQTVASAQQTEVLTGTDAEGRQNVQITQRVIKMNSLSDKAKDRMEKLIDTRRQGLTSYLDEMRAFADEANQNIRFSQQESLDELEADSSNFKLRLEEINNQSDRELEELTMFIKNQRAESLARLEKYMEKIKDRCKAEMDAAKETVDKKYAKKVSEAHKKFAETKAKIEELKRIQKGEILMRQLALKNSFNQLRSEVEDERNKAVERLWTQVTLPEHAVSVLEALPDAAKFRKEVTPDHLFAMFNSTLNLAAPTYAKKALCAKCESDDLRLNSGNSYFCRKCSYGGKFDSELQNLVGLPSLAEIVSKAPRLAAPAPEVVSTPEETSPTSEIEATMVSFTVPGTLAP